MNINSTHQHIIRVYTEDVDYMGIVYHANYLRYLERSRTEVLRTYALILSELEHQDTLFAISDLSIKYKAPARLDDLLTIDTTITEIKKCSFTMEQRILNQHQILISVASLQIVCVTKNLKPKKLPSIFKK